MAKSEIISALNSLRVCLESKLLVTNQIVEEFKASMDSHFASFQHNEFSHGFSSPPSLSHPHGHPPRADSLHHYIDISPLLKSGFREPMKATPLIYVSPFPPPNPFPNSILTPNSDASIEIVENDSLLDYVEIKVDGNVVVENMEVVVGSKLKTESVEVVTCEFGCNMDVNAINYMLQFETIRPLDVEFSKDNPRCVAFVPEEKSAFVGGISSIVVRKRGVVLTLYALEEVYKEFLSLHLEDKVVLKGRGVDTTLLMLLFNSIVQ